MVFTQEKNAGFTLMEAVVVLGLITLLSTATLINFTGVNDALTLRKERFQAALAIREAQNMALAIRLLSGGVAAPGNGRGTPLRAAQAPLVTASSTTSTRMVTLVISA